MDSKNDMLRVNIFFGILDDHLSQCNRYATPVNYMKIDLQVFLLWSGTQDPILIVSLK
jgi:hypothetical protein